MNSRISIFPFLLFAFAAAGLSGTAEAGGTLRTYYKTPTGTFGGPDRSVVDPMTTTTPTQASGKNVTAYPPAGQKLTGWYFYAKSPSGSDQPQGESLGTANPLNVKISEGNDRWLVAHFAWITYKVDYDYAGGSSTGSSSSKLYTDTFNLAAASEKTGYTFGGWKALSVGRTYSAGESVSGEDLCPSDWHEDGETVTLKAQWTANPYSVTYKAENCTLMSQPSPGTYDQPLSIAWVKDDDVAKKSTVTVYDGKDGTTQIKSVETTGTTFDFKMSDLGKGYYESVVIKVACTKNVRHDLTLTKGVGVQAITWQTNDCAWVRSETDVNLPGLLAGTTWAAKVEDTDVERGYTGPNAISGTLYANVTRELKGTPHQYTVDYDLQGGEKKSGGHYPSNESFGDGFYVSAPTRTDRTFLGWIVVTNKDDLACAKWGTSADDITHDVFADTPCANGATGDVFFKNLTSINGEKIWLKAKWSGLMRTITVVSDPAEAGSASGGGEIEEGAKATLAATPNDGYSFCCWTNSATGLFTNDNPWTFTVTADETYTAVFTGNVYTVRFQNSGEKKTPTKQVTFGKPYGDLPVYTDDQYVLEGWYTEDEGQGTKILPTTPVTTAMDHNLYANWTDKTAFDVVYADPSFVNAWITNSVDRGHEITDAEARDATKNWPGARDSKYWIKRWEPTLPLTVVKDETISAVWESYADVLDCTKLMFSVSGDWKPYADDYVKGDSCMRLSSQNGVLTTVVTNSGTLAFHWKGGYLGTKATELQVKVGNADPVTFTSTSGMDWVQTNVVISAAGETKVEFSCRMFSEFCQIDFVTWEEGKGPEKSYTISFDANGGSGVMENIVCKEGETFTFPDNGFTPPDAGATFLGWNENAECSGRTYVPTDSLKATADRTFYAKWRYTIAYKPGAYSRGQNYSDAKDHGASVPLRDKSYDHTSGALYAQDGWSENEDGSTLDYALKATYSANESVTLYPHWKSVSVSDALDCPALTFSASGGWTVVEDPSAVNGSCMRLATHDTGNAITVEIREAGKLSFDWKGVYDVRPTKMNVYIGDMETPAVVCEATSGETGFVTFGPYEITASSDAPVVVKFAGVKSYFSGCSLDHVVWTPEGGGEPTPGEPVAVTAAGVADGVFSLTVPAESGTDYGVWTNADLTVGSWGLMGEPQKGEGTPLEFSWPILPEFPQLFFRAHKVEYK